MCDMEFATTRSRESGREEGQMASIEMQVREFAAEFDTPNVRLAVSLAEAGTLSWDEVYEIFRSSLRKGLAAVA